MTATTSLIPGTTQPASTCVDGVGTQSCYQTVAKAGDAYFTSHVGPFFLLGCAIFSVFWGTVAGLLIKRIPMDQLEGIETCIERNQKPESYYEVNPDEPRQASAAEVMRQLNRVGVKITDGAKAFLYREYLYLGVWSCCFAVVLGFTVDNLEMNDPAAPTNFPYTATSYLLGSITSIMAGYIGMRIAVFTNTRVTFQTAANSHKEVSPGSKEQWVHEGFVAAFRGGQVLGFVLVGLAVLNLTILVLIFKLAWFDGQISIIDNQPSKQGNVIAKDDWLTGSAGNALYYQGDVAYLTVAAMTKRNDAISLLTRRFFELVAGYGLGGSSVALFGRVGGGIYTKAADVGADLVGKTLCDLKEDDISNPGTIADNVGDNVGDIAGMGSDLFGSLAESTCAALVVSGTSIDLIRHPDALFFPLCVTASGILASWLSVLLIHIRTVTMENVQSVLKFQIGASTVIMTFAVIPAVHLLPDTFIFLGGAQKEPMLVQRWHAYGCIMFGLWSGMIIGFITEYYTNNAYMPTKRLAIACELGPAPNIILGIALGYLSCVVPIACITATIGYAFYNAGMYGIGLSALGMLGSLPVALSVDGYGPISDNAGGVAEMSGLPSAVRDCTDALDAAGNTTAAVGKGFAIGSACLVGLALFGAFITRIGDDSVDILRPTQFAGLLVGAMLPYFFSALTMQAVGDAAQDMMRFIIADYREGERKKANGEEYEPDYDGCISISTEASLKLMVAPGALVLGSPLVAGFVFGPSATAGLLAGSIVSGIQVAISASNTGGAWDNAKKEVEQQRSKNKEHLDDLKVNVKDYYDDARFEALPGANDNASAEEKELYEAVKRFRELKEAHVAAVVGDTVGDPLKDTSGPAINILVKLSAITSLVFGTYIERYHIWGGV